MTSAGELVEGAVKLGDRFGVVFVLCVGVAAVAVACAFLAVRALWHSLQAKETEHRAERKEDRDAHLAVLERLGSSTSAGLAELGRKMDRVEDLVARPPVRAA